MNKDKRNNIQLLGTLNNADESGIIANANQIYDANEDKSTQDVSKEHTERIKTLEDKENSMQTTLENITKTGEASAASNVTYNHSDSKLDATNVQQAVDEVRKRSNYNDGDNIIDFNTIHIITDNPEFAIAAVDINNRILYGIKKDGQPYWGIGVPKVVRDYVDKQVNDILGTDNITEAIDSLKEVEKFLSDFKNSDTLKALLDTKANKVDVDFDISAYHATDGTLATYDNLAAALGTNGENIPQSLRKGGMSVKFVQTSDNNYVQYRYILDDATTNSKFTNVNNWVNVGADVWGINAFNFDFSTGTIIAYSKRLLAFNFIAGHVYQIKVTNTDDSVTTYFSTRNSSDPETAIQNSLCFGKGARSSTFTCTTNADSFCMSLDATMETGIIYNVGLVDLSADSIATHSVKIAKLDRVNHLVVNSQFIGAGNSNVNVIPEGLIKGRTYSLTFNGNDVISLDVVATKEGSSDFPLWSKDTQTVFEFPILFYIPDDYDYVKFKFKADYGKAVIFSIADVTETLLSLSELKIPLFELGQQYSAVFPQEAYGSTLRARIKPGYRMHLKKGDIIHLKNSGYRLFLHHVRMNDPSTNYESGWQTSDYTIPEEGLYCMAISPDPETGSYTDSKTLASQIEIISKEENDIQNNKVVLDSVVKSLQYNIPNDNRTFSFKKTGHYITTDGTLGDSTNWWMGNVVRLYKGETVEVFCATTDHGVIIALTDLKQSFYTPVVVVTDHQVQALHKYTATEDCYIILQYYTITGSPSIYTDSERVISIENRLADIESDIEESKASKPQYVIDETERIKRKLLSMLNGNATIFAFNTDQHFEYPFLSGIAAYNPKYVMHGVNAIVDVAKEIPLDMIVLGGDVSGYDGRASSTIKGILQEVEYLNSPFMDLNVPEVSIPGNHDAFQNNGNITAQGMYNVHFKRSKWYNALHHSGSDNCDCYYDDTDKKIRYIFVDTYSRNVRTESYTTFLSNALSSMSEGYKAIIFSHNPLTNEFTGIVKTISSSGQEDNAFQNPTDLHSTINQYAENVVACICGHSHCDAWGINSSGVLFIETTTAAPHTIYHTEDGIPYKKTTDSVTETAFDFFVIDLDNQTIEAVRYGQGTNRKWKYKGTGQGLISYKNCVSGAVSIPSLTLTFTNSGDNTDVVNVTCDGNGFYEVYLTLGDTYTITCNGYTLDVSSVEVSENKVVNITATSK